jgi:hypothetical protein
VTVRIYAGLEDERDVTGKLGKAGIVCPWMLLEIIWKKEPD